MICNAEESLLALRSLGLQTISQSPSYLLPASTRFIPTAQIRDIFIHEAFRGFEVRYYLTIIVEGEGEAVVVFPVSSLFLFLFLRLLNCCWHIFSLSTYTQTYAQRNYAPYPLCSLLLPQKLLPSLVVVEQVWRGARECLYEPLSPSLSSDSPSTTPPAAANAAKQQKAHRS